jgi:adenylylsulfate kinase
MKLENAFCVWFTGLPSSGKTTTAIALNEELRKYGIIGIHLDGDIVRKGLNSDLGLSAEDRAENNRRTIHVAEIAVKAGVPVYSSFISPYKHTRDFARGVIPDYIEVFVDTSIDECMVRDVKGLYAKAKAGEIKGMTGVDDPYERPENPEMVLDTINKGLAENVERVISYLVEKGYLVK